MKKITHIPLLLALCFAAVGCGGGSDGGTLQAAALRGMVVEVDGQTADRDGVQITVVETGDRAVTDQEGRFQLAGLPAGRVTLAFSGRTPVALAQQSGDDSEDENEFEDDNDSDEDDEGRPVIVLVNGETVEIRCSLEDGKVVEFSRRDDDEIEVTERLAPAATNPFANSEGKVEVELEDSGRSKIEFEVDHIPAGTVVEFFLDGSSIGTAPANSVGEAELEFEDSLPAGATNLAELEGAEVEYRLASDGTVLFTGTVPGIPDDLPLGGGGEAIEGSRARSRARLTPFFAGAEGDVEMRRRPEHDEQEFEIDAQHLDAGLAVKFQIEDPENAGSFITLATIRTDAEGEADYDIDDGFPLPLEATDVSELVGLQVRVVRADNDEVLLSGI
ncbi:MAG: peptidase associated/transthyretin-like domain-containing protein, partial [Planctomycetota bacterium]